MVYKIERRMIPGLVQSDLTSKSYIIAHESGNGTNNEPDALENELTFMKRNYEKAFVSHFVGGGGRIVQLASSGKIQFGCGPKGNPHSYAQVELARTNNKETFKKDYAAYIWLLCKLAKDANIPIKLDGEGKGIKTHDWITKNLGGTTHNDPYSYLLSMGVTKAQFTKDIQMNNIRFNYYTYKPKKIRTITKIGLYADKEFKKAITHYPEGTLISIKDIVNTKSGIPRLKTERGYITANRQYVQLLEDFIPH